MAKTIRREGLTKNGNENYFPLCVCRKSEFTSLLIDPPTSNNMAKTIRREGLTKNGNGKQFPLGVCGKT